MEQLTLFNSPVARRRKSSPRRKVSPAVANAAHWDLWTQEKQSETFMALLFLDIRNFTPLAEKQNAFNVIAIVKKLFSAFQHIIRTHHGKIIETTGDGLYAAFGFGMAPEEAMDAAVKAGKAILTTLEKLNARSFEQHLQRRLEVGIGIHAGNVATGTLHISSKDHLVVMGYPVNVASRIQAATKELNNNMIVSSTVFGALRNPPEHFTRISTNLRGIANSYDLFLIGTPYEKAVV